MSKAVFLDRDGTIIKDKNYLENPEKVEWFDGVFECLKNLSESGFELVVVTNQSGVARGYMTEEDVNEIHDRMRTDASEEGVDLDHFYYCPYLEDGEVDEYRVDSELRKPAPGMILQASEELGLDPAKSYMVGDKISDVRAGENAGCETILLRTRQEKINLESNSANPDFVADNFVEAAEWILGHD